MNILDWIQNRYKSRCDGQREHLYGIKIDTIGSPERVADIDITETEGDIGG
jgi:hypothetical protein